MLYVSYNTKAGWSELQAWRTLILASCSTETVSSKRIQKLRTLTSRLVEVQGERLEESMRRRYEKILKLSDWYSAHEYLNSTWNLFSPSEVINAFGESSVTYIGNLEPLVNFKGLCLPASELALIDEISESVAMSEDMFTLLTKQGFRKDIFIKGPVRLPEGDRSFENYFQLTKVREITTPVSITGFYAKGDLSKEISKYLDSNIEVGSWIQWDKIVSDLGNMGHSKLNVSAVCQALISNGALRLVDTRRLNKDATSKQWKMFNQLIIDKVFDSDPLEFWLDERRGTAIAVPRLQLAIEYLRRNQESLDARNIVTSLNKRGITLSRQGEDNSDQMQVAERQLQQFMTTRRLIDAVTG